MTPAFWVATLSMTSAPIRLAILALGVWYRLTS